MIGGVKRTCGSIKVEDEGEVVALENGWGYHFAGGAADGTTGAVVACWASEAAAQLQVGQAETREKERAKWPLE